MNALTREELIAHLLINGFTIGPTESNKWWFALVRSQESKTLVILIRGRGVDLLLTQLSVDEMLSPSRRLRADMQHGFDIFEELHYEQLDDIHEEVKNLADAFKDGASVDQSLSLIVSNLESSRDVFLDEDKDEDRNFWRGLRSIGDTGHGGRVYLYDGVWI